MAEIITAENLPADVQTHELITVMVAGANAKASRVAPCLAASPGPTPDQISEAKLILVGAVKRWAEAGSGAFQQQTAGPFSVSHDTRQRGGFNLWPSEITALQEICKATGQARATSIMPTDDCSAHPPWCSLSMGAAYCSCGTDIAGYPIYELDES